jgi:hypothetical protein
LFFGLCARVSIEVMPEAPEIYRIWFSWMFRFTFRICFVMFEFCFCRLCSLWYNGSFALYLEGS